MKLTHIALFVITTSLLSGPSSANPTLCAHMETAARHITIARQNGLSRETLREIAGEQDPIVITAIEGLMDMAFADPIASTAREKARIAQINGRIAYDVCREQFK
jgi:hypothetical protein